MSELTHLQRGNSLVIRSKYWQVEHRKDQGGCWSSIKFTHGSGKNLLARPAGSRVTLNTILGYEDMESPIFPTYHERLDTQAALSVQPSADGLVVLAEGRYRDEAGKAIPLRFRHRYEYREYGLIAAELEVIPEGKLEGVIELTAVDMQFRPGLTHTYVRQHPATNPNVDLRGGSEWYELRPGSTAFRGRYVPVHAVCFERGVEGLDVMPTSDLNEWDTACSPSGPLKNGVSSVAGILPARLAAVSAAKSLDSRQKREGKMPSRLAGETPATLFQRPASEGLGLYLVSAGRDGKTNLIFSPYCVGFRRVPVTLDGPKTFRLYWTLPFIKPAERTALPYFHAGADSNWPSDADLEELAAAGIKLIRFHNDYREDGPFWHDGVYPPYDPAGMKELARVVATCHRLGMKIVPYMSLKELHPEAPGYAQHAEEWTQVAAPALRELHTWFGTGEFGRLMCMQSGWLDRRKRDADTILSDLPWDGLYFDWTKPLPCAHETHLPPGRYHTDTDAYLDFLLYIRRRLGADGVLFLHLSGFPYIYAENMADVTIIYEDVGGVYPDPDRWPIHCQFMPIVSRYLATGAKGGTTDARRLIMASLLQGYATSAGKAGLGGYGQELLDEIKLFECEDLGNCRITRGAERAIATGNERVFASAWRRPGKVMVYLGNFTGKSVRGKAVLPESVLQAVTGRAARGGAVSGRGASASRKSGTVTVRVLRVGAKPLTLSLTPAALSKGIAYSLKPWQSLMVHLDKP